MQLNNNLNIKHSQSIVMTPQLRQAIKLLQFSNLEPFVVVLNCV